MQEKNNNYQKPEITVIRFDNETRIATTSGYAFLSEGFGDEVYW